MAPLVRKVILKARESLYCDTPLAEYVRTWEGSELEAQPPIDLSKLAEQVAHGQLSRAIAYLRLALELDASDSMAQLQYWAWLRALDYPPMAQEKDKVLGIVLEIGPIADLALVCVAGFRSGVGAITPGLEEPFFSETEDQGVLAAVSHSFAIADGILCHVPLSPTRPLPAEGMVQICLLTPAGLRRTVVMANSLDSGQDPLAPMYWSMRGLLSKLVRLQRRWPGDDSKEIGLSA